MKTTTQLFRIGVIIILFSPLTAFAVACDVVNHATLSTNLIAYWELEESSGTRFDSKGSNDLTDNNTVGQATGASCIQGSCADSESTDTEYFSIADNAALSVTSDLSYCGWWNWESELQTHIVDKYTDAPDKSYHTLVSATTLTSQVWDGAGSSAVDTITKNTATWYHICMTYDASAGNIIHYLDGTGLGDNTSQKTSITDTDEDFNLGRQATDASTLMDGLTDEVGIWDKFLTSSEVDDIYNSGAGVPYQDDGTCLGGGDDGFNFFQIIGKMWEQLKLAFV